MGNLLNEKLEFYIKSRSITPEQKSGKVLNQTWPIFYDTQICVSILND
jgi:hypothetical protein